VVIVMGRFEVDPNERDAFLAGRQEIMRRSRAEAGCLEYTFAADPIEPGRVVLVERWLDQASLDGHLAALRAAPPSPDGDGVSSRTTEILIYDAAGERRLGR
jgi:quinol monooxygenase YgiN